MPETAESVILTVEDDQDHALLIELAFEESQVPTRLAKAYDGEEALAYLFDRDSRSHETAPWPALILLDLRLPKYDGLDVLRTLKRDERTRAIPVVIFTSSSAHQDMVQSAQAHANSYVVKPAGYYEIVSTIDQITRYWLWCHHQVSLAPGEE